MYYLTAKLHLLINEEENKILELINSVIGANVDLINYEGVYRVNCIDIDEFKIHEKIED